MDNKALFESVMLDDADAALLAADLSKIAAMIEHAAHTIDGMDNTPKPDAAWQRTVPASDPETDTGDADIVTARHEVKADGRTVSEPITVPRVVA